MNVRGYALPNDGPVNEADLSTNHQATIATLTADLAAERALANQLAEWLLRIVPDQDRDLNDALTEWEARRER